MDGGQGEIMMSFRNQGGAPSHINKWTAAIMDHLHLHGTFTPGILFSEFFIILSKNVEYELICEKFRLDRYTFQKNSNSTFLSISQKKL